MPRHSPNLRIQQNLHNAGLTVDFTITGRILLTEPLRLATGSIVENESTIIETSVDTVILRSSAKDCGLSLH
jgi:hypothetical protein